MGREIKRVPLDFDWPTNKTWGGFLMPESLESNPCPDCQGGQTYAGWWLQRFCQRLNMLADDIAEQQRGRPLHPWLETDPYPVTDSTRLFMAASRVIRPSADMVDLVRGLGSRGMGSDHKIYQAIAKAAGLPKFGHCATCDGQGGLEAYPGQRAGADAWESTEPPAGDGWQLWETVSEGSPISPVFPDAEQLAQWLTTEDACWGVMSRPMTIEQARGFVGAGWAPSMIGNAGGMHDGATYIGTEEALGPREP